MDFTSIRSVVRGYWQGVKKLGRAYTLAVSSELNSEATNKGETTTKVKATNKGGVNAELNSETMNKGITDQVKTANQEATNKETASQDTTNKGGATNQGTTDQGSDSWAFPIFTERPFIRPLSRRGSVKSDDALCADEPSAFGYQANDATKRLLQGAERH